MRVGEGWVGTGTACLATFAAVVKVENECFEWRIRSGGFWQANHLRGKKDVVPLAGMGGSEGRGDGKEKVKAGGKMLRVGEERRGGGRGRPNGVKGGGWGGVFVGATVYGCGTGQIIDGKGIEPEIWASAYCLCCFNVDAGLNLAGDDGDGVGGLLRIGDTVKNEGLGGDDLFEKLVILQPGDGLEGVVVTVSAEEDAGGAEEVGGGGGGGGVALGGEEKGVLVEEDGGGEGAGAGGGRGVDVGTNTELAFGEVEGVAEEIPRRFDAGDELLQKGEGVGEGECVDAERAEHHGARWCTAQVDGGGAPSGCGAIGKGADRAVLLFESVVEERVLFKILFGGQTSRR